MTRWLLLAFAATLPACPGPTPELPPPVDEWDAKLAERVLDYSAALRIAALRLTGELPTLAELKQVADAPEAARRQAYEAQVDRYLTGPRFARQMFRFWQDTLKLSDDSLPPLPDPNDPDPERLFDTAPAFVAKLVVDDRSFLDALTATSGTCPRFDPKTGQFTPADCPNLRGGTVGLLTHPGVNRQFFGNFAFRRVRWVQETFACTAFPAEVSTMPARMGNGTYTGTFPFASIAGTGNGGRVNFLDTSSIVCANCHANMNHIASLFAHYNSQGTYSATLAVPTPLPSAGPDPVLAVPRDYLPDGEPLAWRHGTPVASMTELGAAMAADPDISECVIARLWNWALGKTDIVDGAASVPPETIGQHVAAFETNGHRIRGALRDIFTSDDFVRF